MNDTTKYTLALLAGAAAGLVAGMLIASNKDADTGSGIKETIKKTIDDILTEAEKAIEENPVTK